MRAHDGCWAIRKIELLRHSVSISIFRIQRLQNFNFLSLYAIPLLIQPLDVLLGGSISSLHPKILAEGSARLLRLTFAWGPCTSVLPLASNLKVEL